MNYSDGFYRSAKTLSLLAVTGLVLTAFCELLAVIIGFGQIINPKLTSDFLEGGTITSLWLLLQSLVALFQIPVFIFTVVFFLIWLNRANKNLAPLQAQYTEFSSGWAVGWWFVPFANLVKPFQVIREVWSQSDPDFDGEVGFLSSSMNSAPTYMGFWWAFWIISNIFSNITARVFDPEDISTVEISGYLFIISGILSIIAAALAIMVVRDITQRQELRFAKIGVVQQHSPPPPSQFGL